MDNGTAQERSRSRRELLLDTALELYAESGRIAVTHRAVAQRAGVPMSTIGYYFGTVDGLLTEAIASMLREWKRDYENLDSSVDGDPADLRVVLSRIVQTWTRVDQPGRVAGWRVFVAAAADPVTQPLLADMLESVRSILDDRLGAAGADVDDIGLLFQIMLMGTSILITGRGGDADTMAAALRVVVPRALDPASPAASAIDDAFQLIAERAS